MIGSKKCLFGRNIKTIYKKIRDETQQLYTKLPLQASTKRSQQVTKGRAQIGRTCKIKKEKAQDEFAENYLW